MVRKSLVSASLIMVAGLAAVALAADPASPAKPTKEAIERSRKTVKMLDDVYKNAVVLITDKYVHDEDDFAAGSAAVLLFKNVSKPGVQQVRLLDATGEPYNAVNVAKDAFEKEGIKQMLAGEAFYDEVIENKDGKFELHAMTTVPVVMDKCIMCHPHYAEAKKQGKAIGAISYIVPIE